MTPETLSYLQARLEGIQCDECVKAARLVAEAMASVAGKLPTEVERDLCHTVWGCVRHALDVAEVSVLDSLLLEALEAEMAGRVLTASLATVELVEAAKRPRISYVLAAKA